MLLGIVVRQDPRVVGVLTFEKPLRTLPFRNACSPAMKLSQMRLTHVGMCLKTRGNSVLCTALSPGRDVHTTPGIERRPGGHDGLGTSEGLQTLGELRLRHDW